VSPENAEVPKIGLKRPKMARKTAIEPVKGTKTLSLFRIVQQDAEVQRRDQAELPKGLLFSVS
jgi:hypothetical protein